MPLTKYIQLSINEAIAELSGDDMNIELNFIQNEPEEWQSIQSSGTSITLPATKANDKIFNTYHNSDILDLSPGQSFRNLMDAILSVNGSIPILKGKIQLDTASYTDKPEAYTISMAGGNGDWIIDGQNITLWDCLSTTPHTFDVATIEASWANAVSGGYDSDEAHDYVYAPVRYRQPFQYANPNSNILGPAGAQIHHTLNAYMLRPSLSIYWMIIRFFRLLGYSVKSQFLNTAYFRRQVMPWGWGDFFSINSQLVEGITFKAYGTLPDTPPTTDPHPSMYFTGTDPVGAPPPSIPWTVWSTQYAVGSQYIFTRFSALDGDWSFFQMPNTDPPNGYDNFGLYSFDETTGTMTYTFNPPAAISPYIGTSVSLTFTLNLYFGIKVPGGSQCDLQLEVYNGAAFVSSNSILPSGGPVVGGYYPVDIGTTFPFISNGLTVTVFNETVPGVNIGDVLHFRLKTVQSGASTAEVVVMQAGYLNNNPSVFGGNQWQYDFATQRWANLSRPAGADAAWQETFSTFLMTGLVIQLGNNVNFQYYDSFRSRNFLDMLGGLVDAYDLEVSTDPISMSVTIEPFLPVTVPDYDVDGNYVGDITLDGYYNTQAVNDWTNKQDFNKEHTNENFSSTSRQIDYNMKQDGSNGGANIWAARNLAIYLNNVIRPKINNTQIDNGIIAGVPGASRYVLPDRFAKGNVQYSNRFFSSSLHYNETQWQPLSGVAPQLMTIFPENINDSSASAVSQIFEPMLAFYKGYNNDDLTWFDHYGGIVWAGDPADPLESEIRPLPFMFSVNYGYLGEHDPVLTYSDQIINGVVVPGLMRKFHLPRLAVMRNGQLKHAYMRLNLNDITNFGQRNCIKIGNGLFAIISINGYKPLSDESCEVIMWKIASIERTDIDNCFPSQTEVLTSPLLLAQYDLRYGKMLLFPTDIPQVG